MVVVRLSHLASKWRPCWCSSSRKTLPRLGSMFLSLRPIGPAGCPLFVPASQGDPVQNYLCLQPASSGLANMPLVLSVGRTQLHHKRMGESCAQRSGSPLEQATLERRARQQGPHPCCCRQGGAFATLIGNGRCSTQGGTPLLLTSNLFVGVPINLTWTWRSKDQVKS